MILGLSQSGMLELLQSMEDVDQLTLSFKHKLLCRIFGREKWDISLKIEVSGGGSMWLSTGTLWSEVVCEPHEAFTRLPPQD